MPSVFARLVLKYFLGCVEGVDKCAILLQLRSGGVVGRFCAKREQSLEKELTTTSTGADRNETHVKKGKRGNTDRLFIVRQRAKEKTAVTLNEVKCSTVW